MMRLHDEPRLLFLYDVIIPSRCHWCNAESLSPLRISAECVPGASLAGLVLGRVPVWVRAAGIRQGEGSNRPSDPPNPSTLS